MGDLSRELGDTTTAEKCDNEYKKSRDAILSKMWISEQKRFNTLYVDSDGKEKASVANTIQNLFPLLLKDLPT